MTVVVNSRVGEVLEEMERKTAVALEAVGLQGETNAKMEITAVGAVDTGNLRNSICRVCPVC